MSEWLCGEGNLHPNGQSWYTLRNQQQIRGSLDCCHVACLKGLRNTTKKNWANYLHN